MTLTGLERLWRLLFYDSDLITNLLAGLLICLHTVSILRHVLIIKLLTLSLSPTHTKTERDRDERERTEDKEMREMTQI